MPEPQSNGYVIQLSAIEAKPLSIQFEPAGGEYVLAPGEHLKIVVRGPENETIEVVHGNEFVTIWPSPRLRVRVFHSSGEEVTVLGY
jgi:hypothetical protein